MLKVTCAIIVRNGKLLVTQRGPHSDHPWEWEFPGGKIKTGETAEESIVREIREELDVKVRIIRPLNPVEYDYGFRQVILIPFLCEIISGEIQLSEHNDFRWIKIDELSGMHLSATDRELVKKPGNRKFLKEYFGKNMNDAR